MGWQNDPIVGKAAPPAIDIRPGGGASTCEEKRFRPGERTGDEGSSKSRTAEALEPSCRAAL